MPVIRFFVILLAVLSLGAVAFGQSNSVDTSYQPVVSVRITGEDVVSPNGVLIQADGKPVIWGWYFSVDGTAKALIARLNAGGTVDNTFSYCGCLLDSVGNVALQADGKFLIAGSAGGRARIVRLNSDGSHDPSFYSVFDGDTSLASSSDIVKIQPDGRILANLHQSLGSGYHAKYLFRLNTDGSTDSGFTSIGYDGGRLIHGYLAALTLDSTGRIYAAVTTFSGGGSSSALRRYNPNGSLDNTWTSPSFSPSNASFSGLAIEADGSLLISGKFDTVNGVPKRDIVRVLVAGNVDLNFNPPILGSGSGQMQILASGKILVAFNTTGNGSLARLNADGTLDATFTLSPSVNKLSTSFALDASGRILFLGLSSDLRYLYFRLNPNGDLDGNFSPNVTLFGQVHSMAWQTDGHILIAGKFTHINGTTRGTVARISAAGVLDATFNAGAGFDYPPHHLVLQTDGKIIASGFFSSFDGTPRQGIARINGNGSLDFAFDPLIEGGSVNVAAFRSDGKILIGGGFTSVNGTARTGVALLNSDGTLDTTFNAIFGSPSLTEILQQADGKIMIGGGFSGVNGFNRSGMVRLNSDGSLDQTFDAGLLGGVERIWRQSDGKYLITGNGIIRRRNANGSADASFISPTFDTGGSNGASLDTLVVQPDGTLVVGGRFNTVNGSTRRNLVRLTATGGVDLLFFPNGADAQIRTSLRQPDGKILLGGDFRKLENVIRSGTARLTVSAYRAATQFDFEGDGKADIAVYRPSSGVWYQLFSSGIPYGSPTFGLSGDVPVPADFDGDGRTDLAIFRPSTGTWWYSASSTGQLRAVTIGQAGDIPLPSDINNDGTDDFVVFRPSTNTWHRLTTTGIFDSMGFGLSGDMPVIGDFDGDGKADRAIFRPSSGDWWYAASSAGNQHRFLHWGATGDIPVPADYDGDGKTDIAVFRPSNGGWYVFNSSDSSYSILGFGLNGDRPIPADYDGDGRADIAVFRPSNGVWYLMQSTAGTGGVQWGIATDVVVPGAFLP